MQKMGKREYIKMFCESFAQIYGTTLLESNVDINMAENLLKKLRKYLSFKKKDMSDNEWIDWRSQFLIANNYFELEQETPIPGVDINELQS